jgi:amino acid permease
VGRIITDVVLIFCQVGSCAAFLILVLGNVQAVLRSLGVHVAVELIAAALVPIIIALALPRSTTFLASAAHFGNFTMLAALGTIGYYGLVSERDSDIGAAVQNEGFAGILGVMRRLPAFPASATDLSIFFGISAFSFAAHCEVVAVEADAPSRDEYVTVLARSMALITSLYILIGVYAFACFNTATQANIMLNLGGGGTEGGGGEGEGSEIFVNIVRVAVSCTLLVNVAMALLPASQTLDLIIIGPAPLSIDHPHQVEPSDSHSNSYGSSNALSERSALLEERSAPTSPNTLMNGGGSGANSRGHSDDHWPAPVVRLNTPALDASELAASEEKAAAARAYHRKGNWLRVGSVLGFVIFALLVQNLSIVFSLVGSIAGGLVCFSLPPLFAWRMACLEKQVQSPARVAFLAVQVLFGIVLIGLGLEVIFVGEA